MTMGAKLIADDQTLLRSKDGTLWASRPETLPELIEARGVGLICAPTSGPREVALMIDLNSTEEQRMPEPRVVDLLGEKITVWRKVNAMHFPAAIFVYLSSMPAIPNSTAHL